MRKPAGAGFHNSGISVNQITGVLHNQSLMYNGGIIRIFWLHLKFLECSGLCLKRDTQPHDHLSVKGNLPTLFEEKSPHHLGILVV